MSDRKTPFGIFNPYSELASSPHSEREERRTTSPLSFALSVVRPLLRPLPLSSHRRFDGSNLRRTFAFYDRRFTTAASAAAAAVIAPTDRPTSQVLPTFPSPLSSRVPLISPLPFPFLMKALPPSFPFRPPRTRTQLEPVITSSSSSSLPSFDLTASYER